MNADLERIEKIFFRELERLNELLNSVIVEIKETATLVGKHVLKADGVDSILRKDVYNDAKSQGSNALRIARQTSEDDPNFPAMLKSLRTLIGEIKMCNKSVLKTKDLYAEIKVNLKQQTASNLLREEKNDLKN